MRRKGRVASIQKCTAWGEQNPTRRTPTPLGISSCDSASTQLTCMQARRGSANDSCDTNFGSVYSSAACVNFNGLTVIAGSTTSVPTMVVLSGPESGPLAFLKGHKLGLGTPSFIKSELDAWSATQPAWVDVLYASTFGGIQVCGTQLGVSACRQGVSR